MSQEINIEELINYAYKPKHDLERKLYSSIEEDDDEKEKFIIIDFSCNNCNYSNDIGIKKGTQELECPNCEVTLNINWGEKN